MHGKGSVRQFFHSRSNITELELVHLQVASVRDQQLARCCIDGDDSRIRSVCIEVGDVSAERLPWAAGSANEVDRAKTDSETLVIHRIPACQRNLHLAHIILIEGELATSTDSGRPQREGKTQFPISIHRNDLTLKYHASCGSPVDHFRKA